MKYEIEGRVYEFDQEYDVEEAMLIYDKVGVGVSEIGDALRRGNPYMLCAMMLIIKRRAGEAVRWEDLRKVPLAKFRVVPEDTTDEASEATSGEAPDPTGGPGTSLETDTGTTS